MVTPTPGVPSKRKSGTAGDGPRPSTRVRPRTSTSKPNHDPSPIDDLPAIVDNLERSLVVFTDGTPSWLPENIDNKIFECTDQYDTHSMLYICALDQLHRRIKHRNPTFSRPEHLPSSTIVNAMRKRLAGTLRTGRRRCNHCRGVPTPSKDKYRRRTHWLECWARDAPGRCAACVAAQRRGCSFEENGPPEDDGDAEGDAEDDESKDTESVVTEPQPQVLLPPAELRKLDLESLVTLWYPVYEGFRDAVATKDPSVCKRLLEAAERLNTYFVKLGPEAGPGSVTPFERMVFTKWSHVYRGLDDVFRLFNAEFTAHAQSRLNELHKHVAELAAREVEFAHLYAASIENGGLELPKKGKKSKEDVDAEGEDETGGELPAQECESEGQ